MPQSDNPWDLIYLQASATLKYCEPRKVVQLRFAHLDPDQIKVMRRTRENAY